MIRMSATTFQASNTEGLELLEVGGRKRMKRNEKTVFSSVATFSLASSDSKTALEFMDSGSCS